MKQSSLEESVSDFSPKKLNRIDNRFRFWSDGITEAGNKLDLKNGTAYIFCRDYVPWCLQYIISKENCCLPMEQSILDTNAGNNCFKLPQMSN
jgi:hypothetical protein